jgi:hypothetical protein
MLSRLVKMRQAYQQGAVPGVPQRQQMHAAVQD